MNVTRKAINFDLDVQKLKENYPNKYYNQAYVDIRKFLEKNGFAHRQGSGYISNEKIKYSEVTKIIGTMNKKMNWLHCCVKELDVTSVGKEHSLLYLFESDHDIEEKMKKELEEDLKDAKQKTFEKIVVEEDSLDYRVELELLAIKDHIYFYEDSEDGNIYAIEEDIMNDDTEMMNQLINVIDKGMYYNHEEVKNVYIFADMDFASSNFYEMMKSYKEDETSFDYVSDLFVEFANDFDPEQEQDLER